ncbi:MAG: biotin/lipoyl-containing protein [Peptococcaceae bacterium]
MEVKTRVPGKIVKYEVKAGDTVKKGQVVAVMEAMKMQNPIPAPQDGTVQEVKGPVGERLNPGTVIMIIE